MRTSNITERKLAIMQLKQGTSVDEVAQMLKRHPDWVRKWQKRFAERGWSGLKEQCRAPKRYPHKLSAEVQRAICQARLELEAEAALGVGLKYIGGLAVRTRLKKKEVKPLPSISSIERVLRKAKLTRAKERAVQLAIRYPHLQPKEPHQLCQVDIVPHFLQGGQRAACFNALDVVSRYPTGRAFARRRSQDAVAFLVHVWQEIGIPRYTQVDNESCFSGGATHPYVLGKVLRLALEVGTELLFSPVRHPESNGFVERFHRDYDRHVWEDTYLSDLTAVDKQAIRFFDLYRQRQEHSRLQGQSPHQLHTSLAARKLTDDFTLSTEKRPLRPGRVHFMRRLKPDGTVRVLNVNWSVPRFEADKGVWVTIKFQMTGATLSIFDATPDRPDRACLAVYPFPLKEPVLPHTREAPEADKAAATIETQTQTFSSILPPLSPVQVTRQVGLDKRFSKAGQQLLLSTVDYTVRFTRRVFHTMF